MRGRRAAVLTRQALCFKPCLYLFNPHDIPKSKDHYWPGMRIQNQVYEVSGTQQTFPIACFSATPGRSGTHLFPQISEQPPCLPQVLFPQGSLSQGAGEQQPAQAGGRGEAALGSEAPHPSLARPRPRGSFAFPPRAELWW